MSISIRLTDEQAKQLAADIIKLNRPDEPAPLPDLPAEPTPPEPPEGFHKAMMGPLKVYPKSHQRKDVASIFQGQWEENYTGDSSRSYALRIGSEIAKLNWLEPETKPDTARREWDASVGKTSDSQWLSMPTLWNEKVRVREVLPGDPTPEQVEELVSEAEAACRAAEILDVHHASLKRALAPFRKP